jgi:hypothetical protein
LPGINFPGLLNAKKLNRVRFTSTVHLTETQLCPDTHSNKIKEEILLPTNKRKHKMKLLKTLCLVTGALLASIPALAQSANKTGTAQTAEAGQIPQLLSYQGVLHDNEGNTVGDGSYAITFTLYGQAESADALWSETRQVELAGGVFHVHLGSVNALSLPFDRAYWLGIAVGEAGELAPRIALTATPYSFMARTVADGAVTGDKLALGAVTSQNLADSSVTASKIHPDTDITTTGTIQAASFVGDGTGLTGLPSAEFSLPLTGTVNAVSSAIAVTNTSATGFTFGVQGQSNSTDGRGVFGIATAGSGGTYGVWGLSHSTEGRGVYGVATATSGTAVGVWGQSNSTAGRGVYGIANATSGSTFGVWGLSQSTEGRGVYGVATATSGSTFGVWGGSNSTAGWGVYGVATAISGQTIAVRGLVNSPEGYSAYFSGVAGSKNYFERSVGIGIKEPSELLHVFGGIGTSTVVERNGGAAIKTTAALNEGSIGTSNNTAFRIVTNNTVRMHIPATGGVGIGTTNPGSFLLAVNGDAAKPGGGSWSNFSDQRLKNNIQPLDQGSLDRLLQLKGYTFEYLDEAVENRLALPGRQTGLIAQEVLEVFPEWIGTDDEGYLYITERGLTAMLIEALRELKNENQSLNHRIEQLELQLIRITLTEYPLGSNSQK